jgi:hypothetical protein
MVRGPTHVARVFRGRARSLPVEGVSVPRPGRARPGARPRPRDGGGRRSARRRIALRIGWRRRERENEGDADRGEDCVAHGQVPILFVGDDGAKLSDPLYTPIVRLGALTLKLGNPHLHRAWGTIGP